MSQNYQSLDLHSSIHHFAEETTTNQEQRIILGHNGRGIFRGHIRLHEIAQNSTADQLCRSMMLGDQGRLQVMPQLEIQANQVKCSHGAAVADLDTNAMFYLASRGISQGEARKMLLKNFILDIFKDADFDKKILQLIFNKMDDITLDVVDELASRGAQQVFSM